jgi:hypothetical protein
MLRVGRPDKIDKNLLKETLLKYKKELIKENFKIISKSDAIWVKIASELNNLITPVALYTFVTCNKFGIRDILSDRASLCHESNIHENNEDTNQELNITESTRMSDSTLKNSLLSSTDGVSTFMITIPKDDFLSLIIYKKYRRTEKNRPLSTREYAVLQPGLWQHVFSEKIWQCTKISCGFNFKRHKLLHNAESGCVTGTCKCGSVIKCVIDNSADLFTKIKCTFIEGQGRCGKRYFRNPIRQAVVEKLQGITATKYRTELAENLMQKDDNVEPPHLYNANVLRIAKYDIILSRKITLTRIH